jgi:hypothetical protein
MTLQHLFSPENLTIFYRSTVFWFSMLGSNDVAIFISAMHISMTNALISVILLSVHGPSNRPFVMVPCGRLL